MQVASLCMVFVLSRCHSFSLQLDIFFGMIRAVNKLIEDGASLECNQYMRKLLRRNYRQSLMSVFTESQVVEESIKSTLIEIDPLWKKTIIDSEKTFLDGQTGALLAFSGITEEYNIQIGEYQNCHPDLLNVGDDATLLSNMNTESHYYYAFINYLRKFLMLFDKEGVKKQIEDEALFRRALLCYGGEDSYMLPPGKARQSFLDNTDRDFGFKRFLRDDNNGKRQYLKQLMDDLSFEEPVCDQLQKIVDLKSFNDAERWKEYFVKIPEILECVQSKDDSKKDPEGKWIFSIPQRFIRKNSSDDILLLSRYQTNSINRELYSYVLFLKARKKGLNVHYYEEYTDNAEKYAFYNNKQDEQIQVIYKEKENVGFCYIARKTDGTEVIYYETLEGILDYVEKTIC